MNIRASYLLPLALMGLGIASCSSVVDPDSGVRSVKAAAIGDDCVTNAGCDGAAGEICCGGTCVNRTADNSCGTCGNVCPGTTTCLETATCGCSDPATTRCGNNCVDLLINNNNCGGCGTVCPAGTACDGAGACACTDPNLTKCGNTCVDLTTSNAHCGACGTACAGATTCLGGACGCANPAHTQCGNTCVDVLTSNTNCGDCGITCQGATTCLGGACGCANPAHTQCGSACVDVLTSNTNCGDCGITCSGATTCLGGACGCANPALTQCGNACINILTDNANCGACGTVCAAGQTCQAGECHVPCGPGLTNCNEVCVNLTWHPGNCGACDNVCDPGDPADPENFPPQVCGNGTCASACPAGQTSCNRSCRNLQSDNGNCGACGNTCAAGTTCTNGSCGGRSCLAIKQANPAAASGNYTIDPDGAGGAAPFSVYCDMTTEGGGWTRINGLSNATIAQIRQPSAQQLIKCTDGGSRYVSSPSTTAAFSFSARANVPGTWGSSSGSFSCGANGEIGLATFGFACSNGPGGTNKVYPGHRSGVPWVHMYVPPGITSGLPGDGCGGYEAQYRFFIR